MTEGETWASSIAIVATIVSALSWLASQRNAKAAENSVEASVRSAKASEDSAEIARLSYELGRKQYEEEKHRNQKRTEAFRKLYIQRLLENSRKIYYAVLGKYQADSPFAMNPVVIDWESIRHVPQEIIFADDVLIDIFTDEERKLILQAWSKLNYMFDNYGGVDDPDRKGFEYAHYVIEAFGNLVSLFERR